MVWQAAYLPFGQAQVKTATVTNNLRFPGQYFDADTGLHYNWNQYYDPGVGRYISADPIGLAGGINLYAYVGNNPVNWVDLEVLFSWGLAVQLGQELYHGILLIPTSNTLSLATNLRIGGSFAFSFDHPFSECTSEKSPWWLNVGVNEFLGISGNGNQITLRVGLGASLSPVRNGRCRYE